MKVSIRVENKKFSIPVPITIGTIVIRCISKKYITKEQKILVIESLKIIRKELKKYKGIKIVEVDTASGEHVSITV